MVKELNPLQNFGSARGAQMGSNAAPKHDYSPRNPDHSPPGEQPPQHENQVISPMSVIQERVANMSPEELARYESEVVRIADEQETKGDTDPEAQSSSGDATESSPSDSTESEEATPQTITPVEPAKVLKRGSGTSSSQPS